MIAVPLPDIRGRVQILKHHMRDVIASPEADPTILARGTAGFSGADLENLVKCVFSLLACGWYDSLTWVICSQAAIQASKHGFSEVMLSHFEWARDRIIMGSERKSAYIDEKSKLMTAYHEVRFVAFRALIFMELMLSLGGTIREAMHLPCCTRMAPYPYIKLPASRADIP